MNKVRLARARDCTPGVNCGKITSSSNTVYRRVSNLITFSLAPVWAVLLDTTAVSKRGRSFASGQSRKEATVQQSPATAAAIGTS